MSRKRNKGVALIAVLLLAVMSIPVFAAKTPVFAAGTDPAEPAVLSVTPLAVDQNFSFEDGAEYVIVNAGSNVPERFALSGQLQDGTKMQSAQVAVDETAGTLTFLKESDTAPFVWEAEEADGPKTLLKNTATGNYFNFSQMVFSAGALGTQLQATYDGRIGIGTYQSYDYYLICRYSEYTPVGYFFCAGSPAYSSDAAAMPMSLYKVNSCEHPAPVFVKTVAPTCTQKGYDEYHCDVCGKTLKRNYVPAAGHAFVNGICDVCGVRDCWDGTSLQAWTQGNGTQKSPYLIENEAMLAYLAAQTNNGTNFAGTYFKVTKDLDLDNHEWTSIADAATGLSFAGNFDGGGHTISNLYIHQTKMPALFGSVGAASSQHAVIKNLVIRGKNVSGKTYAAGLAAQVGNCDIINVGNEVDVTGRYYVGGLVGCHYNLTLTMTGCYNKGTITGTEAGRTYSTGGIGGLVGQANGITTIKDSYNLGDIRCTADKSCSVGGLAGFAESLTVEQAYSAGQITGGASYYTSTCNGAITGFGVINAADSVYYLSGSADAINGNPTGGTGNTASYTNSKTLLSKLSNRFTDGTELNQEFSGAPALTWEIHHLHQVDEITKENWMWSEDKSRCLLTYVCTAEDCYGTPNGDGSFTFTTAAAVTVNEETPATCVNGGHRIYTATAEIDGKLYQDVVEADTPATGEHLLSYLRGKAATCMEDGYEGYYKCKTCEQLFADKDGTEKITEAKVLPAAGHQMEAFAATEPTYRASGNSAYWHCTVCGNHFADAAGNEAIAQYSWILPKRESDFAVGDVNRDGAVNAMDAALLKRYLADKAELDAEQIYLSDFNGDEGTSLADVQGILQYSAGSR